MPCEGVIRAMNNQGIRLGRREFANALPIPVVLIVIGILISPVASSLPYYQGSRLLEGTLMTVAAATGLGGVAYLYRSIMRRFRDAGLNAALALLPLIFVGISFVWGLVYPWVQSAAVKSYVADNAGREVNVEDIYTRMSEPVSAVGQFVGFASIAVLACVILTCLLCPSEP